MLKTPGAMYPKCNELFPAEHQQIGQPARWTCLACGASGELAGSLSICKPAPAPAPKGKPVHPHWTEKELRVKPADDFLDAAAYVFQGLERFINRRSAADPNAAMIARDGPAKPAKCGCQKCGGTRGGIPGNENRLNGVVLCDYCTADAIAAPTSTAKPALAAFTRSPDLSEAKHQVNAQHAMAAVRSAVGG